jgi:hypothetical protein
MIRTLLLISRLCGPTADRASVVTALGHLAVGFAARRAAGLGPLTVVSCDTVPGNGEMARRVVSEWVAAVSDDARHWGFVRWSSTLEKGPRKARGNTWQLMAGVAAPALYSISVGAPKAPPGKELP